MNQNFAQFNVIVNEQSILANDRVKYKDFEKMSISFKNPVKLLYGRDGFATMNIHLYGDKAEQLGNFSFKKNNIDTTNNVLVKDTIDTYNKTLVTATIKDKNGVVEIVSIATLLKRCVENRAKVAKVVLSIKFRKYLNKGVKGDIIRTSEAMPLIDDFVFYIDVAE